MSDKSKPHTFYYDGREYQDLGDGTGARALRPNEPPAPLAAAITPHHNPEKRSQGFRIEWVFLIGSGIIACIGLASLPAIQRLILAISAS